MPQVVIVAQVEDGERWETEFRTHGELFRSQTINNPIRFSVSDENEVAILFEPEDQATYLEILDSPATHEAMEHDGVKRDTVQIYLLDKSFQP